MGDRIVTNRWNRWRQWVQQPTWQHLERWLSCCAIAWSCHRAPSRKHPLGSNICLASRTKPRLQRKGNLRLKITVTWKNHKPVYKVDFEVCLFRTKTSDFVTAPQKSFYSFYFNCILNIQILMRFKCVMCYGHLSKSSSSKIRINTLRGVVKLCE